MTVQMLYPDKVADAFVKKYYQILNKRPEEVYRFYHDFSLLGWPGPDGVVTPVTTLRGIKDKIMSSDYKDRDVKIENVVAQVSLKGGVIVAVNGFLTRKKDKMKQNFSQTFFLAEQERGFFVLNDILRIFDICESKLTNSDHEKKVQKKVALEKESHVTSPKAIDQAVICGSKLTNSDHVDKKVQKKVALAKESRVTSPKAIDQAVAPSTTKASTPSSVVPKSSAPPNNVAPKLPDNSAPNTSACAEVGAAIYIGKLPYNVTKQEVAEVLKEFGPIRESLNSILLKKYKNGLSYGFVEFESTDASRKAVEARYVKFGKRKPLFSTRDYLPVKVMVELLTMGGLRVAAIVVTRRPYLEVLKTSELGLKAQGLGGGSRLVIARTKLTLISLNSYLLNSGESMKYANTNTIIGIFQT